MVLLRALFAATIGLLGSAPAESFADAFPSKPVRLIVGHAPGGRGDTLARIIAPKLAELWGQPVLIENRVGAAGNISAAYVAKSPPDGHTLLISTSTNLAFSAVLIKDLPFDPLRDFAMIGRVASVPSVLAVSSRLPVTSVSELVAYARAHPGRLTGGSSGTGSSSGFALEMLKSAAGIDILQVPYGGLAPAVNGLLSGQVDVVFAEFGMVRGHADTGAVRILAAGGSRRYSVAPDLPTLQELGLPGVDVDTWLGIVAPARTPPEVRAKLVDSIAQIVRMRDVQERLLDVGFEPVEDTPESFAQSVRADIERYSVVARRMGLPR
ncbi:MAG TPA: tripartite tricarboxylate transporter substrate binding protein [Casimicrobiaceae bacterium]|nr:tripartite tricarboxylate transporter substrate binding protein [Casimicrobiaceae bacterium]